MKGKAGSVVIWSAGGRNQLNEELEVEKRGGFWGLGRQVQGGEENPREYTPTTVRCLPGAAFKPGPEPPKAAPKALAN